jgi:hypothetical protein
MPLFWRLNGNQFEKNDIHIIVYLANGTIRIKGYKNGEQQ